MFQKNKGNRKGLISIFGYHLVICQFLNKLGLLKPNFFSGRMPGNRWEISAGVYAPVAPILPRPLFCVLKLKPSSIFHYFQSCQGWLKICFHPLIFFWFYVKENQYKNEWPCQRMNEKWLLVVQSFFVPQ